MTRVDPSTLVACLVSAGVGCSAAPPDGGGDDTSPLASSDDSGEETASGGSEPDDNTPDTSGASDTGSSTDSASEACDYPEHVDPIDLNLEPAAELPATIFEVTFVGEWAIACGDGFVARADLDTGHVLSIELDGLCTGLAAIDGRRFVAATASSLNLLDIDLDGELREIDSTAITSAAYGVAASGSVVAVACGSGGLLAFDTSGDAFTSLPAITGAEDARGVVATTEGWLVADGTAGIKRIDDSGTLAKLSLAAGVAADLVVHDDRAVVLLGALGVALLDIGDGRLSLLDERRLSGRATGVAFRDDSLVVTLGHVMTRFAVANDALVSIGQQERTFATEPLAPFFGALGHAESRDVVATGNGLRQYATPIRSPSPHASLAYGTNSFWVEPGQVGHTAVVIRNSGDADLVIGDLAGDAAFSATWSPALPLTPRLGCPGQFIVEPGDSAMIDVSVAASDASTLVGDVSVRTSDPDATALRQRMEVNSEPLSVGSVAVNYRLPTLAGAEHQLASSLGKVVIVKLFDDT